MLICVNVGMYLRGLLGNDALWFRRMERQSVGNGMVLCFTISHLLYPTVLGPEMRLGLVNHIPYWIAYFTRLINLIVAFS